MFEKFYTIVIIPRKTSAIKKIRIPIVGMIVGVLTILGLIVAWSWMVYDYFSIRSQLIGIEQAESSFEEERRQIEEFTKRYESIQMHFEHLQSLNYKLRLFTSPEGDRGNRRGAVTEEERAAQKKLVDSKGILAVISSNADELNADLSGERIRFGNLTEFFSANECPLNRVPRGWPVKGLLMSEYGVHADPITTQIVSNHGISIATSNDAAVRSTASGLVLYAGKDNDFDNLLTLDHGNGYITRYGYVGNIGVEEGELVKKGDVIARMEGTEESIGPRLYYEVTLNHVTRNPIDYME